MPRFGLIAQLREGTLLVKVLLRNLNTRFYLRGESDWTPERGQARDFGQSAYAVLFALDRRLCDVEAVLSFGNPQFDLCIPLKLAIGG
jgi:hypothetical protein